MNSAYSMPPKPTQPSFELVFTAAGFVQLMDFFIEQIKQFIGPLQACCSMESCDANALRANDLLKKYSPVIELGKKTIDEFTIAKQQALETGSLDAVTLSKMNKIHEKFWAKANELITYHFQTRGPAINDQDPHASDLKREALLKELGRRRAAKSENDDASATSNDPEVIQNSSPKPQGKKSHRGNKTGKGKGRRPNHK